MTFISRPSSFLFFFAVMAFFQVVHAASTPAGQQTMSLYTSLPKKSGESLFSYTAEWQLDGDKLNHATGMIFLNADKVDAGLTTSKITKKMVTAMRDGMTQLDPKLRGITIEQVDEKAKLILSNKAGYRLDNLVFRDYTNQALRFDMAGKSFNAEGVQIAVDVVLAAEVEYLDKFSGTKPKIADAGEIEIRLDEQTPIRVKTDGKTPREIEMEITRQLGGSKLNDSTLVASQIHKDTRNIKPFDGSEVLLSALAARSISIDVQSSSVGVLVKFKFKGDTGKALLWW